MKKYSDWLVSEESDPTWDSLKTSKIVADESTMAFVLPFIEKIAEAMVLRNKTEKIKTFRDLPPKARDQAAKAIMAATMQTFFPASRSEAPIIPTKPTPPTSAVAPTPQEELVTPAASKG